MEKDILTELETIERDHLEAERVNQQEKACLLKVTNTLGMVVSMSPAFETDFHLLKELLALDRPLPVSRIDEELGKLRSKIFSEETKRGAGDIQAKKIAALREDLLRACRTIRKVMVSVLENFYPLPAELKKQAEGVQLRCQSEPEEIDLEGPTNAFLGFVQGLKSRISEDMRYVNNTFFVLLDHVKELERALTNEFGDHGRIKDFEQFEGKVNREVGSIIDSFSIHTTINELKSAVLEKMSNIKRLLFLKKEQEMKRSQKAQENIERLKTRIMQAEKDAHEMSKRVQRFKMAASKDGLTGLFNRKAFDTRVEDAMSTLTERGKSLSLVIFDVDDFKDINDTFGHVAGDKVLKKVADCLRETFRKDDFIARYGGDEFAVLIDTLTEEMARQKIRTFKENFRKKKFFSQKGGDIKVSVTAGIAIAQAGERGEDLIHRADMAMYALKKKN